LGRFPALIIGLQPVSTTVGPQQNKEPPMSAVDERVRSVVEPVVRAAGLDLEDVLLSAAGRRRVLRVVVDGDNGAPMDVVAEVARAVSDVLDSSDVMGGQPYVLEVSSPGVDRPLTAPRHWRRSVRRLVKVDLIGGGELIGRVESADDEGADLLVDQDSRRVHYSDVSRARVQIEFSRSDGPDVADVDDVDDEDEEA
jgi:ribosome maturation factor RimP